jgi:hypothetical protein
LDGEILALRWNRGIECESSYSLEERQGNNPSHHAAHLEILVVLESESTVVKVKVEQVCEQVPKFAFYDVR